VKAAAADPLGQEPDRNADASRAFEVSRQGSALQRYQIAVVLGFAAILHALLFAYDLSTNFEAFLWGDRSWHRSESLQAFLQAERGHVLATLASGSVGPGEFLLIWPSYVLGGAPGIVLFQIALFLLSVYFVCAIAQRVFPWPSAALICGTVYVLLPQNIVFTHQLVTEAIATPLTVAFLYCYTLTSGDRRWRYAIAGGLALGLAIFVRPSLAFILPPFVVLHLLYRRSLRPGVLRGVMAIAAVALIPMMIWVAAFTLTTGKFGYTGGVANLGWNLRSKVFLVYSRNGLEKPPEVQAFQRYDDLYGDLGGISTVRFLEIASDRPLLFVKAAATDAIIIAARGNVSKVLVDYLGIARNREVKNWRDTWSEGGVAGLLTWMRESKALFLLLGSEAIASIVTGLSVGCSICFLLYALARARSVSATIGAETFGLVLTIAAVLCAAFVSGQLVDQAQARLRHPAEAGLVILIGILVLQWQKARLALKTR
jgi:4-amino-4-deoxy-L-arabinose transferase-like glycosyltransferase